VPARESRIAVRILELCDLSDTETDWLVENFLLGRWIKSLIIVGSHVKRRVYDNLRFVGLRAR
jgi:hypothetical protein